MCPLSFIFSTYRCRKCGIKFPKQQIPLSLYPWQWSFLDRMRTQFSIRDEKNDGKPLRCLLDFTQEGRCKRGMTDEQKAEVLQALEKEMFDRCKCGVCVGVEGGRGHKDEPRWHDKGLRSDMARPGGEKREQARRWLGPS